MVIIQLMHQQAGCYNAKKKNILKQHTIYEN